MSKEGADLWKPKRQQEIAAAAAAEALTAVEQAEDVFVSDSEETDRAVAEAAECLAQHIYAKVFAPIIKAPAAPPTNLADYRAIDTDSDALKNNNNKRKNNDHANVKEDDKKRTKKTAAASTNAAEQKK